MGISENGVWLSNSVYLPIDRDFSKENDENPDEKTGTYFQTNPWDQKKMVLKPMVFLHDFSFKHPEQLIRWEEPDALGTPNSTFQLTCYEESKTNRSMDLEWKIMKPYRNLNVDWNDFQEWSEHIFSDSIIAVNIGRSKVGMDWIPCWRHVETGWVFFFYTKKKNDFQRVDSLIIIFPGSFSKDLFGRVVNPTHLGSWWSRPMERTWKSFMASQ